MVLQQFKFEGLWLLTYATLTRPYTYILQSGLGKSSKRSTVIQTGINWTGINWTGVIWTDIIWTGRSFGLGDHLDWSHLDWYHLDWKIIWTGRSFGLKSFRLVDHLDWSHLDWPQLDWNIIWTGHQIDWFFNFWIGCTDVLEFSSTLMEQHTLDARGVLIY